jgi:uncharacterized protein (DUF4415 family)
VRKRPNPFLIDDENPERTTEDFKHANPARKVMPPEFFKDIKKLAAKGHAEKRVGRPSIGDSPKVHIGFRLDADVVAGIRASGPGYNARVEKVLRAALARGRL